MWTLDNPGGKYTFVRPGKEDVSVAEVKAQAEWATVLKGKAYEDYMRPHMPNADTLEILRKMRLPQNTVIPMAKRK